MSDKFPKSVFDEFGAVAEECGRSALENRRAYSDSRTNTLVEAVASAGQAKTSRKRRYSLPHGERYLLPHGDKRLSFRKLLPFTKMSQMAM
jgi:hypothetical protein